MAAEVTVKQIEAGDRLTGLSLGHPELAPLKAFVQRHALAYERQSLARTYGAFCGEQKLKAYITLVCGQVEIGRDDQPPIPAGEVDYRYPEYPAVKIARLAVHQQLQGSGIGRGLVAMALGIAKDQICPSVGCRFMMVDSKQRSIDFYLKCGFTILDTVANRQRESPVMYIDLGKT